MDRIELVEFDSGSDRTSGQTNDKIKVIPHYIYRMQSGLRIVQGFLRFIIVVRHTFVCNSQHFYFTPCSILILCYLLVK